jgi:SAM-dependent methyltransferase
MFERFLVPVYLPGWISRKIVKVKRGFIPPAINIRGERHIEWSFLSQEMPQGPGEAIDFGCEEGYLSLLAAEREYHVIAVDLQKQDPLWDHSNVEFRFGDFRSLSFPSNYFDLAINCSSVEHVGVAGRYGIALDDDKGDFEVMEKLADVLKPEGRLIMTAPCGRDAILAPWCRVYGRERLPKLLAPFNVEKELYWMKDAMNRWLPVSRNDALDSAPRHDAINPHGCLYGLVGLVLRKK